MVDTDTFRYYTTFAGELIGKEDNDGCQISIGRYGPSAQVGNGASGINIEFGASAWLDLNMDCGRRDTDCGGEILFNVVLCD